MRAPEISEGGFTIVEVLVAAVILVIGAMTTFSLLTAATRNAQRAKATQVALDMAQQELERLRSYPNDELAMEKAPPQSTDPLSPNFRVNSAAGTFAIQREPVSNYQTMVVKGGVIEGKSGEEGEIAKAVVKPAEAFENGDVTGTIYRYVVWRDDACCAGKQDYKQAIIAIKLNTPGNQAGERGYVEVQTDFVDPKDNAETDPLPNAKGEVVTGQQFFLSDSPCSASPPTARQEVTGDHPVHNTLGTCASGLHNGTELGAPDVLLIGRPPDPAPDDPNDPLLYDYASDDYLDPSPDTDKGLQIRPERTDGCNFDPVGSETPQAETHRWVTDPMLSEFIMNGTVTLEFYTRALSDQEYTGKLCVYLFRRHETGSPPTATNIPLTNVNGGTPYWTYSPSPSEEGGKWPRFKWKKVRLTMAFVGAPYPIPIADRLGIGLSVERAGTTGDALSVMYDHPDYPSRVEVDTSTPIPGA